VARALSPQGAHFKARPRSSASSEPLPASGRGGVRRRKVAILWVTTIVGVYVLTLVGLLSLGRHITLPDEALANATSSGGLNASVRELVGRGDPSDFLIDYASAHALVHGGNAYGITANLVRGVGPAWPVETANPHPPTTLTLVLPATLLDYQDALAAWDLLMIFALAGTIYLLGARLSLAITLGLVIGLTFPGAYGISNSVPIIGLGIAIAYRWRDTPAVAGLGVALAAAPKSSGLLLVAAFLVSGRIRAIGWTAFWYGLAAVIPLAFDHHVWSRYFKAGLAAVTANSNRGDNASLLHLGRSWGMPDVATLAIIATIVGAVALLRRDLFWPSTWAMVATLPIAWMYSLMTFLPLVVWAVVRCSRRSASLAILASGFTLASAPLGTWGTVVFPIVTLVMLVLLTTASANDPGTAFWIPRWLDPFPPSRVTDLQMSPADKQANIQRFSADSSIGDGLRSAR